MKCTICHKAIILHPSANERAKSTGMPASYFTELFREHSQCVIDKRSADALALMQRINSK